MDKKERLGEFYIDFSAEGINKQKKEIVKTINKFINKYHSFAPVNETSRRVNRSFVDYAISHNMKILNINYFARGITNRLIDSYSYINGRRNDICIMRDSLGVNHIMLIRNNSFVNEISALLGIDTLKDIYTSFVYNIEDLKGNLRLIKELNNFIKEKILNKYVLLYKGSSVRSYYYTKVKFDSKDFILKTNFIKTTYNFNDKPNQYDNTDSFDGIDKIYKFCSEYITNSAGIFEKEDDVCEFLVGAYNKFNDNAMTFLNKAIDIIKAKKFEVVY